MKKIIIVMAAFVCILMLGGCSVAEDIRLLFDEDYGSETEAAQSAAESTGGGSAKTGQADEADVIKETEKASAGTDTSEPTSQAVSAAGTVSVSEVVRDERKILLIGDSRTVALYCSQVYDEAEYPKHIYYNIDESNYTGYTDECIITAKGGEEYNWMRAVGMPILLSHIDEARAIVIWFGVNDLLSFPQYIEYANNLAEEYSIPVFYMTIGACNGKSESKNEDLKAFNSALEQFLNPGVGVIDVYSFVQEGLDDGTFATLDGLHYDYKTSSAIYEYMVEQVDAHIK